MPTHTQRSPTLTIWITLTFWMEWIKSFISNPEAPALPTHTQRSPTPTIWITLTIWMAWIKSFFISKPEAPALPTDTQRSSTLTIWVERIKSFISKPEAPALPTHTQRSPTLTRSPLSIFQAQDMGNTILTIAFSAAIGLVVFLFNQGSLTAKVDPPFSLCILGLAILISFSASFLAITFRHSRLSRPAEVLEHIGIVSTVVAFFTLMSFLLPSSFLWLVLAACVVLLLGYVICHVERFRVTGPGVDGR